MYRVTCTEYRAKTMGCLKRAKRDHLSFSTTMPIDIDLASIATPSNHTLTMAPRMPRTGYQILEATE